MATLSGLPNEILSLVSSHLDRPKDVLNLALTSRRLHEYTRLDGWKAFLKGRFGLAGLDLDARNAVHGLTTLCRNWDRKAFVARDLEPSTKTTSLNTWEERRWSRPGGQTMGYQPKIDSYEETLGSWTDRREVLAWSAGTNVIVRVQETGSRVANKWKERQEQEPNAEHLDTFNDFGHLNSWYTYKIPQSSEGRDDITSLKLLRPYQKEEGCDGIAFGSASGHLSLLHMDTKQQKLDEQSYVTEGRVVGSLSISSANTPLMAANLGDLSVALFPIDQNAPPGVPQEPLSEVSPIISGTNNGRLWTCNFLSDKTVAIGLGPSYEPIQIYEVTPTGFSADPIRKFSLDKIWGGVRDSPALQSITSVYPILPIPTDAQGGSERGNVFLSGGFDGIIRLHDMRSPHDFETMFSDPTNACSIYSLALQGLERVVAGTSMHSMLKVFDLRLSGSHAYHTLPAPLSRNPKPVPKSQDVTFNSGVASMLATSILGGWNLFVNPRKYTRRTVDSPLYSISIPSPISSSLYCGIEGTVVGLTFLSILDKHPDPLIAPIIQRFPDSHLIDIKRSYNPSDDVLDLGMYEQGNEEGRGSQLMVQEGVGTSVKNVVEYWDYARFRSLDERWKDPRDFIATWNGGPDVETVNWGGSQRGNGRGGRGRGQRGLRGVTAVRRARGRGQ
ncbi:hypothetical protein K505DRAFT_329971 [Melanomma pulvis-pyrius CBS 109.77]|uniref:F-box domain-containing protein n=1 Tax=Melanomma pulvis-pyrius CBS 109.77 TaxID=1314802 RepID=A0A6A6WST9_9PLEO|nr:hypothetical protein K505DRAFT_329971 [Melanomma pulvis-pyrius CBS 109.77]